jgi:hypothetical protein
MLFNNASAILDADMLVVVHSWIGLTVTSRSQNKNSRASEYYVRVLLLSGGVLLLIVCSSIYDSLSGVHPNAGLPMGTVLVAKGVFTVLSILSLLLVSLVIGQLIVKLVERVINPK